jgi:NhaP-type Na+/H+ or K+/H+ antiporter
MDVISVFAVIAGIVLLGYFSDFIFKKTGVPDVLILILVGIALKEFAFVDGNSFGFTSVLFTTFALIFILFQGALSIDFKLLLRSLYDIFSLTTLHFFASMAVIAGISYLLAYDLFTSLLIGAILAGTSSAVVIPLVNALEISDKHRTILSLESALSDVLCIVGTVTILEIMKTGEVLASEVFRLVLSSFSLAIVVGGLIGLVWIFLMDKYENLVHLHLLTIALVMGVYAFVESNFVQASGAIAALAFGLVLGNSRTLLNFHPQKRKQHEDEPTRNVLLPSAKSFYSEISFFVKTFFFVYLGLLLDFSNPLILVYGALLTLAVYLLRPIIVRLVFRRQKTEEINRTYLEVLIPKGLAAAVLAGIAVQSGLLGDALSGFVAMILSVIFFSIVLTSILLFAAQKNIFKGFLPFLHPKFENDKK